MMSQIKFIKNSSRIKLLGGVMLAIALIVFLSMRARAKLQVTYQVRIIQQ